MQNERKNKSKMRERTFHVCNEPVFRTGMLIIFMRTLVDKIAGSMWLVGSTGGVMLFQTHFYLILNRFLSNQKYFWEKKFLFSLSGSLTNPSRSFYAILNNIITAIFTSVSCGTVWPCNVLPNCILLIIFWHASWWKITEKKKLFSRHATADVRCNNSIGSTPYQFWLSIKSVRSWKLEPSPQHFLSPTVSLRR